MIRHPRVRQLVLLVGVLSLLLGPTSQSSKAQISDRHHWRFDALILGSTNPPPDNETLGLNRTSGPSSFKDTAIRVVIDCPDERPGHEGEREWVVADVAQDLGHEVSFWADDDVTDGFGEVSPTDTARDFNADGTNRIALERRADDQVPVLARVRIRIVTGRFHRIGGIAEVDLRLDIRVVRLPDEELACQTRSTREPEIRIVFQLTPDPNPPGFGLVGVATRHYTHIDATGDELEDRYPIARPICDVVGSVVTTRVTDPQGQGAPFHPCLTPYWGA